MLKQKVSGTKNDLKSFRKWLVRAATILPKYRIEDDPVFKQNGKEEKYYRYEANLLRPFRDGKKTSEIYNAIKPLIADKKGR